MTTAIGSTQGFETRARFLLAVTGFLIFVAIGAFASLVYPILAVVFLAPIFVAVLAYAPRLSAFPRKAALWLILAAAFLAPLWPLYFHLKLGPLPILTPPRLMFHLLTAVWLYDMVFAKHRRLRLFATLKKAGASSWFVLGLFVLSLIGLPLAEGRSIAAPAFMRQALIWLTPFLIFATYMRTRAELMRLVVVLLVSATISGAIAIAEFGAGVLLAELLSPYMNYDAEWLANAQAQKIRDGVFRAQAGHTHPISLGEFLSMFAPVALALCFSARGPGARAAWLISFVVIAAGALATGSRLAQILLVLGAAIVVGVFVLRLISTHRGRRYKPMAVLAAICVFAAAPVAGGLAASIISGAAGGGVANSTQSRIDQLTLAAPKIAKRPLTGYGAGRGATVLGYWGRNLTLDNYYLTLALDLGVIGPFLFLGALLAAARDCFAASKLRGQISGMFIGLASALIVFAASRAVTSHAQNLAILYPLFGALMVIASLEARRARSNLARSIYQPKTSFA